MTCRASVRRADDVPRVRRNGCPIPPHAGAKLTTEQVVMVNTLRGTKAAYVPIMK